MFEKLKKYIDDADLNKFTEDELKAAYEKAKKYYETYPDVELGDVVFFNTSDRGRLLSFSLIYEDDEEGQEEKLHLDENGIYEGYMYIYAVNLDIPMYSDMGSVYIVRNKEGNLRRRPLGPMQCFTFK